jgi:hypothetical protein
MDLRKAVTISSLGKYFITSGNISSQNQLAGGSAAIEQPTMPAMSAASFKLMHSRLSKG